MANTIARAQGFSKDGAPKAGEATRLGSGYAVAQANTWRTFASVTTNADGSGEFTLKRDGVTVYRFAWDSENVNVG